METADPVAEWNRLTELYRQKSDDELELIAADAYDLTDTAREVLTAEISLRKLDLKLNDQAPPPEEEEAIGPAHDIDPVEYDLQSVFTADTMQELVDFKRILEEAGIAHFIGPDHVQELKDFHGSFEHGVRVYVRYVDWQRTLGYLHNLDLENRTEEAPQADEADPADDALPTCPACHSSEIVFLSQDPKDDSKFRWKCEACGNRWTNDGVFQ
jgi:DNA-directed RNA polymerase subunit M/transcription elongation factor TFIIS